MNYGEYIMNKSLWVFPLTMCHKALMWVCDRPVTSSRHNVSRSSDIGM